ncbi:arsenite efflux transporter metallochaperone ArsD [Listeria seeligeri]|uniref:arsenite efflux transporter metallochaperone ArsD n=1 Tax=Listeria seeligeri TaxID=1640 RepID=UPI00164D535A|nr:arsenite efflux transporter metallochaperone ArsD [Listeria seeligeri]
MDRMPTLIVGFSFTYYIEGYLYIMKIGVIMMKNIKIYEPAMCCDTGVCGPGVDQELLRMKSVNKVLEQHDDITIHRYNLTNSPESFMENELVTKLLQEEGPNVLPITLVDNLVMKKGDYPDNEEWKKITGIAFTTEKEKKDVNTGGKCC